MRNTHAERLQQLANECANQPWTDSAPGGFDGLRASEAVPKPIRWWAEGRLPFGMLIYALGEEGIGKSTFILWLCAILTNGRALDGLGIPARKPTNVGIIAAEDDWDSVVVPKLGAAGADLTRCVRLDIPTTSRDGTREFRTPIVGDHDSPDVAYIEKVIEGMDLGAVFVDPWQDTLPDSVKEPAVAREALAPWKTLAERHGLLVMLFGHTNRNGADTRSATGLSLEPRKLARVVLFMVDDVPGQDGSSLFVGVDKANVCASNRESWEFRREQVQVPGLGDLPILTLKSVQPKGIRGFHAIKSAEGKRQVNSRGTVDRPDEVMLWLREYLLREQHGGLPVPRSELIQAAKDEDTGFTERELKTARDRWGKERVVSTNTRTVPRRTVWSWEGPVIPH